MLSLLFTVERRRAPLMTRVVHLPLCLVVLWLGWCFDNQHPAFTNDSNYNALAALLTEPQWATFSYSAGSVAIISYFPRAWVFRSFSATVVASTYALFAFLLIAGNATGTITGFFVGSAITAFVLAFSTAFNGMRYRETRDGN